MKIQSIAIGVTVINLILLTFLLAHFRAANAKDHTDFTAPILRGRAMEIVDSLGRTRASISLQPPVVMNGKKYPETILLRLITPDGKPIVKIGAASDGAAMSLTEPDDDGIIFLARDSGSVINITHAGKQQILKP
ncbi:MAG: hypothetical protein QM764_19400 [Chitinophagaceae bacterium]